MKFNYLISIKEVKDNMSLIGMNDGVMDIHFHNNGTNNQNGYLEAVKMFKNTLYVEQRDTK